MFKVKSIAFTLMVGASLFSITSAYSMDHDREENSAISRRAYDPSLGDVETYIRDYCYENQMLPTRDYDPSLGDVEGYLHNYCKPQHYPTQAHGPSPEEMKEFKRNYFYNHQKHPSSVEVRAYKTQKTKEQQIANDKKFRAVKAPRVQEEKKQLIEDLEASKQALKNPDITIEDDLKYCDKMLNIMIRLRQLNKIMHLNEGNHEDEELWKKTLLRSSEAKKKLAQQTERQ